MTAITGDILRFLTTGRTHVVERNGGEAFVYLAADGTGHMRLDDGQTFSGTWNLLEDGYSTEWEGGRKGDWTLQDADGAIEYVSRDGGQKMKMLGVLFGDSKGLGAAQAGGATR